MVNGNRFSKWQTPLRNAKCSFKVRTQRRPAQFSRVAIASQKDNRIETCTVGGLLFEGEKLYFQGPKI